MSPVVAPKGFATMDDVLAWAMAREDEAVAFYEQLATTVTQPWMRSVLEDFAKEEKGHKAKLKALRAGTIKLTTGAKIKDLKLADYLVKPGKKAGAELDYQETLVLAMQREKASFRLYTDLAERVAAAELREVFLGLAQEEAKHKLRFEVEYDDLVFTEN